MWVSVQPTITPLKFYCQHKNFNWRQKQWSIADKVNTEQKSKWKQTNSNKHAVAKRLIWSGHQYLSSDIVTHVHITSLVHCYSIRIKRWSSWATKATKIFPLNTPLSCGLFSCCRLKHNSDHNAYNKEVSKITVCIAHTHAHNTPEVTTWKIMSQCSTY